MGRTLEHRGWTSWTWLRVASLAMIFMLALVLFGIQSTQAQTFTVLHTFAPNDDPTATLIQDAQGNLYGVTTHGGQFSSGTVFKLNSHRNLTTLYTFTGGLDGGRPNPDLARDNDGNLYGTTNQGGTAVAAGVIFRLDKAGHETVLYNFAPPKISVRTEAGPALASSVTRMATCTARH